MDTSLTEMKTLIGLLILQGIVQKPENSMYLSKTESAASPYFSQQNDRKKIPSPPKIPALCEQLQI